MTIYPGDNSALTFRPEASTLPVGAATEDISMTVNPSRNFILLCFAIVFAPAMPALASDAPDGFYKCWSASTPVPSLDFTLSGNAYIDSAGKAGTIRGSDTLITFVGGDLDGTKAKYRKDAPPTFGILGPRGDEISTCEIAP